MIYPFIKLQKRVKVIFRIFCYFVRWTIFRRKIPIGKAIMWIPIISDLDKAKGSGKVAEFYYDKVYAEGFKAGISSIQKVEKDRDDERPD